MKVRLGTVSLLVFALAAARGHAAEPTLKIRSGQERLAGNVARQKGPIPARLAGTGRRTRKRRTAADRHAHQELLPGQVSGDGCRSSAASWKRRAMSPKPSRATPAASASTAKRAWCSARSSIGRTPATKSRKTARDDAHLRRRLRLRLLAEDKPAAHHDRPQGHIADRGPVGICLPRRARPRPTIPAPRRTI